MKKNMKSRTRFMNPHGGGYRRHTQLHKGKQEMVLREMDKDMKVEIEKWTEYDGLGTNFNKFKSSRR